MEEKVLCFEKALLGDLLVVGMSQEFRKVFNRIEGKVKFLPREEVEKDESLLQLIPYVIVGSASGRLTLSYVRGDKGGEKRLVGNRSIGFGGHINPVDSDSHLGGMIGKCASREMKEELGISVRPMQFMPRGYIYDDSNRVGRVHFGIVLGLVLDIGKMKRLVPEVTVKQLELVETIDLFNKVEELESWSCIALESIDNGCF